VNKKETSTSKRVYFTYVGKETKFMKELHKNSNVNIPYKPYNTIPRLLAYKQLEYNNKYSGNGIYALSRPDCGKQCLGQTDRTFRTRFKEHFQSHIHQNENPKFSQHHQAGHHSFGATEDDAEILKIVRKGL